MINFISNLPRDRISGGFSAMNAAACAALAARHPLTYVGPIDPPVAAAGRAISKGLRAAGLGGAFATFAAPRLDRIAAQVESACDPAARLDFFHGLTPWIHTRPQRPYVAWSDCSFRDYVSTFHDRGRFSAADLARIEHAEAAWLRGARRVLFTSDWAAGRAVADYRLDPTRVGSVGIFGEIEPPDADAYDGAPRFAFVSTDFVAKGGPVVLAALAQLRRKHPDAQLTIVGAAPSHALGPGASYVGYLRKERPDERRRLREILGSAVAVVHPTRGDIAPLLLVEAALLGTPAIASRAFAIPELVTDQQSGLLLDAPDDPAAVAAAMAWVLDHRSALRAGAWAEGRRHTRAQFEDRLAGCVDAALLQAAVPA